MILTILRREKDSIVFVLFNETLWIIIHQISKAILRFS